MPIEVRELIIKARLGNEPEPRAGLQEHELEALKREIVEHCLKELQSRIETRNER